MSVTFSKSLSQLHWVALVAISAACGTHDASHGGSVGTGGTAGVGTSAVGGSGGASRVAGSGATSGTGAWGGTTGTGASGGIGGLGATGGMIVTTGGVGGTSDSGDIIAPDAGHAVDASADASDTVDCPATSLAAGEHMFALSSANGIEYSYFVVVPDSYNPQVPTPMIVNWHALSSSPAETRDLTHIDQTGQESGAIMVYPQSPDKSWERRHVLHHYREW